MNIAIGADHGGFELKELMKSRLKNEDHTLIDIGAESYDPTDDYPDFAQRVAETVTSHAAERGIIICGSGVGAAIVANKFRGIRASLCHDTYSARQGVEHDDLNILCLGARVVGVELAMEIIHAFLNSRFSHEDRHVRRLSKLLAIEQARGLT